MQYIKLIWWLISKQKAGLFQIYRIRTLGGFGIHFSFYGLAAYRIRWKMFKWKLRKIKAGD